MKLSLNLDGTGSSKISTTVPFYDHMLTALSKHSLIDLEIDASGDTDIDVHHTVEDTAIVLGQAILEALGDKKGIARFGDALVPLDDALAIAREIAGRNPEAVRAAKRLLGRRGNDGFAEQFAEERREISALIGRPNQVEAITANLESRPPVFSD